jgi:LAO/AO transport system kinase
MSENNKSYKSALKVNDGIEQPPAINPQVAGKFSSASHQLLDLDTYYNGILQSNRMVLGKAITLIESTLPEHQQLAQAIIEKCLPHSGNSIRIGITGVPGVGKSTFIETLGTMLTNQGNKLAVLAIDPSSQRSKGSILGDKTRMESLSANPGAFIRPSPAAGTLGGVARKTRETLILCEAAGYNVIFIETVGVGQSETAVHDMVDFFLLLMLAGAGDELQGIKRGIMEMADAVVINKAEAGNLQKALLAKSQLENALHYFPPSDSGWKPIVEVCSALNNTGIDNVWQIVTDYLAFTKSNNYFEKRRKSQDRSIMMNTIEDSLMFHFRQNKKVAVLMKEIEAGLNEQKFSAYVAAQKLVDFYLKDMVGGER